MAMTLREWIGKEQYEIVVSGTWPPGPQVWCRWIQHRNGRVIAFISGIVSDSSNNGSADLVAADAFGKACHACTKIFSLGRVAENGNHPWRNGSTIEYHHHWSTTDREPRRSPWGKLCDSCRKRYAEIAEQRFLQECQGLGVKPTVIWETVET